MLHDVVLLLWTIEDKYVKVSRADVRRWVDELKLNGLGNEQTATGFLDACKSVRIGYTPADQVSTVIVSELESRKREDLVVVAVKDLRERKLAEMRFYGPRRTSSGIVRGTHRTTWRLAKGLDEAEAEAATSYCEEAMRVFEGATQQVSTHVVRRVFKTALADAGVIPVMGKASTWFTYVQDLAEADKALEFARRCVGGSSDGLRSMTLLLHPEAESVLLVRSADEHTLRDVHELVDSISSWDVNRARIGRLSQKDAVASWSHHFERLSSIVSAHEARLGGQLERCRVALEIAQEWIGQVRSAGRLRGTEGG